MKATGIVRRIDDLGRVVIPKEIRRSMRLREGDPLEIYTTREGYVCFRKYSPCENVDGKKIHKAVSALLPEGINFAIFIDGDRLCTNDERFPDWAGDVDSDWIREKFYADDLEVVIATDKETDLAKVKEIIKIFVEEN